MSLHPVDVVVPLDFLDHRAAGLHFADIFRDCVKAFGISHFGTPIVYLIILQKDCRVNKKMTKKKDIITVGSEKEIEQR